MAIGEETRMARSDGTSPRDGTVAPLVSLVVPAYNEQECLPALYERIREAFEAGPSWELIVVDDGSRDLTAKILGELEAGDPRVRFAGLVHNLGQTAATSVGIRLARAPLIATLDADMQNDPGDLRDLIETLGDHDAVVGYRVKRNDDFIRRISSRIANGIRNRLTGDDIRDTGCSLKLFRAEAIQGIPLFEGMHRFLPTLLRLHGYSVIEHPVSHHPRLAGRSKYGIRNRAWKGLKDLFAVRWMRSRVIRHDCVARFPSRDKAGSV
jgi:glycosyltransferase involved in cell wall biosynthesis